MTFSAYLQAFHFLRPLWLLAAPVLWGLVFWLARRCNREQDWSRLIDAELLPALRLDRGASTGIRPWPWLALAWTLAAIALAGPSWQRIQTAAFRSPASWVFVLDLSPSMAATDVVPDRVTRARYALDDLLGAAHDARVGLVVFSEEPYVVTPLTEDAATVRALLSPLAPDIMPSQGDQLAPALDQAAKLLEQVGAKDRRIVVLTDGFDDPAAAMSAAAKLKAHGIALSVVGVGTPGGAPLRDGNGRFALDANGQTQLARLDAGKLRQIASSGGGQYVGIADLPSLMADLQASPQYESDIISARNIEVNHWRDEGIWLLPILLLLAAMLTRRGWL